MTDLERLEEFLAEQIDRFAVGEKVTEGRIAGMAQDLADEGYDLESVKRAFKILRRTTDYFPTPKAVIELIGGSPEGNAETAWLTIVDAAAGGGAEYLSVYVYDRAMAYGIEAFIGIEGARGWPALCDFLELQTTPMIANAAKSFKSAYRKAVIGTAEPKSQYFLGLAEASNVTSSEQNAAWAVQTQKDGNLKPIPTSFLVLNTKSHGRLALHWDPLTMRLPETVLGELVAGDAETLRKYIPAPVPGETLAFPAPEDRAPPEDMARMWSGIRGLIGSGEVNDGQ